MVVSLRFGAVGAIGETAGPQRPPTRTFDRWKPMPDNLNETGMVTSERVHVGEIAVILAALAGSGIPQHFA
jgi:hypothetical protein